MFDFITQHQFGAAVAIYWIFSAAVSSLPEPGPKNSPGYLWLFRFAHTVAGNITTAFGSRIPGLRILGLVLIAPLLLSTQACAAHYTVHPGALNVTDSAAYDALLIAETTIDQARAEYQTGQPPASGKDALNALVASYNLARESWLTYRGAITTNVPPQVYFDKLNKNLSDLTNAIRQFEEAK
jgi:hypothetical protein